MEAVNSNVQEITQQIYASENQPTITTTWKNYAVSVVPAGLVAGVFAGAAIASGIGIIPVVVGAVAIVAAGVIGAKLMARSVAVTNPLPTALNTSINTLTENLDAVEQDINHQKQNLTTAQQQTAVAQSALDSSHQMIQQLKQSLQDQAARHSKKNEVDTHTIQTLTAEQEKLVQQSEKEKTELKRRIKQLEGDKTKQESLIKQLEGDKTKQESLIKQLEKGKTAQARVTKQLPVVKKNLSKVKFDKKQLLTQFSQIEKELSALQEQHRLTIESENVSTQALAVKQKEIEDGKQKFEGLRIEGIELRNRISELVNSHDNLLNNLNLIFGNVKINKSEGKGKGNKIKACQFLKAELDAHNNNHSPKTDKTEFSEQ